MKRSIIETKNFEYKRFYSDVYGYIDIVTLDQAQNPNNQEQPNYQLNAFRTWIRLGDKKWECLIRQNWMLNIYLLEGFSADEVYHVIIHENTL